VSAATIKALVPEQRNTLPMQALPGFRDFLPHQCAARNYIFARWREVARRYGFVEWEGPPLEATELYKKKSGTEIVEQLFNFRDKGEREVALRPELTPTLARVISAHEREFKKPLKWFSIGQFFRYEKQQRGRLREHFQLNCDIIGESSSSADAELIACVIDILRAFGLEDFVVRISDRSAWNKFIADKGLTAERGAEFLQVVDKIDRIEPRELEERLKPFGVSIADLNDFFASGNIEMAKGIGEDLQRRGLSKFVEFNLRVVRGLAYYTGIVFEVFDRTRKFRAIAGGGRYDNLISQLSDGAVSMPALGFAMGDVVLGELINEIPGARDKREDAIAKDRNHKRIYVVIAKEQRRADALAQIQQLRDGDYRIDYPLAPTKVARQFQAAEDFGARIALLYGDEWPQVKIKNMVTGEQELVACDQLLDRVAELL
jgi:histidyl-tRNA synthetase